MFGLLENAMVYFSQHVILANSAYALGGFGVALVLQHYLQGNAFLPVWVGWLMIVFSVIVHIKAFMS